MSAALALPAAGLVFRIGADEIGIACRDQAGPEIRSTDEGGHADALLPGGEPVGYDARTRRDRRLAIVAPGMVRDFVAAWREIAERPPLFVAIGGHCAQGIAGALARAHPGARIASGDAEWTGEAWEIAP